jgi:hypothetical protein
MNRCFLMVCCVLLAASPVSAQLVLPGASPSTSEGGAVAAPKAKKASGKAGAAKAKSVRFAPPGLDSVAGKPLLLNGASGLLQISGSGDTVQIDKLKFVGESISDPSQRCVVDIVGETPIKATRAESADGLERFEAEVPACPFAFEVLSGAVLVPSQITACVFKAADCQTGPGGLWGPDGASLEPAEAIGKRRAQAEKSIGKALQTLAERAKDNADASALLNEQKDFAGQRDDSCRSYAKEAALGFCAASLTEARAVRLRASLAALGSASPAAAKAEKTKHKPKPVAKKKPAASAPAPAAAPN